MLQNPDALLLACFLLDLLLVACSHFYFVVQTRVFFDDHLFNISLPLIQGYGELQAGKTAEFLKHFLGNSLEEAAYPAMLGYFFSLLCYFGKLNDHFIHGAFFLFYILLIAYTYKCTRLVAQTRSAAYIAVIVLTAVPVVIFYSRTISPAFAGSALFVAALYHLLKIDANPKAADFLLFGLFAGFALLTHRALSLPLGCLWITLLLALKPEKKGRTVCHLLLAGSVFLLIVSTYLFSYAQSRDQFVTDYSYYAYISKFGSLRLGLHSFLTNLSVQLRTFLGLDNLLCLLTALLAARVFLRAAIYRSLLNFSLLLCLAVFCAYALTTFFLTKQYSINHRYFIFLAPPIAIWLGIYLDRAAAWIKYPFVALKIGLVLSLCLMQVGAIDPAFARKYYGHRVDTPTSGGYNKLWGVLPYPLNEEWDFFTKALKQNTNIKILDINNFFTCETTTQERLILNGMAEKTGAEAGVYYLCVTCYPKSLADKTRPGPVFCNFIPYGIAAIDDFMNAQLSAAGIGAEKVTAGEMHMEIAKLLEDLKPLTLEKILCYRYAGSFTLYKLIFRSNAGRAVHNPDRFVTRDFFIKSAGE